MNERIKNIPKGFKEQYEKLTDYDKFLSCALKMHKKSIRVNTLKISISELKKALPNYNLKQIPWCKEGFWITHKKDERRDIGNLREHSLGYIYAQEPASMIPVEVLKPKQEDRVLDLCAAPGSKTTQCAAKMKNTGRIIANDISGERLKALGINIQRCGVTNTIVTRMQGQRIKGIQFNKILVDAPCSGIGTIRRNPHTVEQWNPKQIKSLTKIQKSLLSHAFSLLEDKGTLVYSTCSLEPMENEAIIHDFLEHHDAKLVSIKLPELKTSNPVLSWEGTDYHPDIKKCLRIYPQDNDTEGFFVAAIQKA